MNQVEKLSAKCAELLERLVKIISIVLVVVLVCTVFFQVVRRTLTGKSFVQIEEFSIVLASWCAFFTVAYALRRRVHVRIDLFINKLPFRLQHGLNCLIYLVILVASVLLTYYGFLLAQKKMMVPMTVLPFASGYWYLSFPAGMCFACLFLIDNVIQELAVVIRGEQDGDAAIRGGA